LEFFGPLNWQPFVKSKILGDWNRKFGRLLFLLFEYPNIEIYFKLPKYLKRINKKYDLVLSIAVLHENHWAVAKIQSKKAIAKTWIADCGDPFVGNKLESIAPPFYFKALENSFLKYADYVTVPTHGAIEAGYKIHYLDIFGTKYRRHSKSVQVRSNVFLSKFREDNQRFFVIEYLKYYTPKEQKKMKQIYKKSLFLKKMFNNKPYFLVKVLNRLF